METNTLPTNGVVALLHGVSAEVLRQRLAELEAEVDAVRLLMRAAVRRERGRREPAQKEPAA